MQSFYFEDFHTRNSQREMNLQYISPLSLLLFQLYVLFNQHLTYAQSFRSLEDYHFNIENGKGENLYDTGILPDGSDVNVYLFKNEPKSYFFPMEGQDSPVSITVIPCSSVIEWKVFYHSQGPNKRDSLEDDPLFLQQRGSQRMSTAPPTMRYLHMNQGRDMTTFKTHGHFPKGILRVVLTAKENNSKVQLYATSNPQSESSFPLLPKTPGVDIVSNDKTSVTVSWKQTPSHISLGQRIKYCVSFNPRENYRTLCALKADLEGEPPPPWPKNAGYGFSWENRLRKRVSSLRKSVQKTLRPKRDIHFECVGARHWATVTSLLAGRQYFVNVFAVNEFTNHSVTYMGATFITPGKPSLPTLHPGIVHTLDVGGSDWPQLSYAFELKAYTKKINVFMQGCTDEVTADIIYEGAATVRDIPLKGFQKITLRHAEAGNYTIKLTSSNEQSQQVKLCYMGRMRKCPFSSVPNQLFLNATKNVASCRSVTFEWISADSHTKYCLYKKKYDPEEDDYDDSETGQCFLTPSNDQWKNYEKLFCRQYKKSSPQRNGKFITETIWGLKMQTDYIFQLQGVLRQGTLIDYEPTSISMGDKCK